MNQHLAYEPAPGHEPALGLPEPGLLNEPAPGLYNLVPYIAN